MDAFPQYVDFERIVLLVVLNYMDTIFNIQRPVYQVLGYEDGQESVDRWFERIVRLVSIQSFNDSIDQDGSNYDENGVDQEHEENSDDSDDHIFGT